MMSAAECLTNSPAIIGRWVTLWPASIEDVQTIYRWRTQSDQLHLWSAQRAIRPWSIESQEIQTIVDSSFMFLMIRKLSGQPIGFIQFYNASFLDGFAFFMQFVEGPSQRTPGAAEATLRSLYYAFDAFPFRKLYAEIFEYNSGSADQLLRGGFEEQGYTPDHVYYAGRYWGLRRLAFTRESAEQMRDKRFGRLLNRHPSRIDIDRSELWNGEVPYRISFPSLAPQL